MPKKKDLFDDPFDDSRLSQELDDLDLDDDLFAPTEPEAPPPARRTGGGEERPAAQRQEPGQRKPPPSQIVYESMRDRTDDDDRPMVGNYQRLSLRLPSMMNEELRKLARRNQLELAPFLRWVIDNIALDYDEGWRPASRSNLKGQVTVAALVAPPMADLLRQYARRARMTFQTFMRSALYEYMDHMAAERLHPEEPEEFIPGEAQLYHWASQTVTKFENSGRPRT